MPTGCLFSIRSVHYEQVIDSSMSNIMRLVIYTFCLVQDISSASCTGIHDTPKSYFWSAGQMHSAASPTVLVFMFPISFLRIALEMVHVCSTYAVRTQSARVLLLGTEIAISIDLGCNSTWTQANYADILRELKNKMTALNTKLLST